MDKEASSTRLQLRRSTSELHQRVDDLGAQLAAVSDPDGYRVFLRTMARVAGEFGAALDRSSDLAGITARSERIVAALAADLGELGESTPPTTVVARAHSDGFAWGVGYALEGSALGAAVLLEEVKASPFDVPVGYFSLLVSERPGRWTAFSAALSAVGVGPTLDEAIKGAGEVFHLVESSFQEFSSVSSGSVSISSVSTSRVSSGEIVDGR